MIINDSINQINILKWEVLNVYKKSDIKIYQNYILIFILFASY